MKQLPAAVVILFILAAGNVPAADFDGDSRDDVAIFRPSSGLWSVRGVTRVYYGTGTDTPAAGDYSGDGIADIAIFRPSTGLWSVRGVSKIYYGQLTDTPLIGSGNGQRLYDYVVKADDGADLERALESAAYDSVYIPAGTYTVSDPITVTHVTRIAGESRENVIIAFSGYEYVAIATGAAGCTVENIRIQDGGSSSFGNFWINAPNVTVRDCRNYSSYYDGFRYTGSASNVTFDNCRVDYAGYAGFHGETAVRDSKLTNCSVYDDDASGANDYGFQNCRNLSNCYVDGEHSGYIYCSNISSSVSYNCYFYGFDHCYGLSSCEVVLNDAGTRPLYGLNYCYNLSACRVEAHVTPYNGCDYYYGSGSHPNSCN